ncbi:hypothetical protein SADUNF_Sadunf19G0010300 [Salix dunnii]|uniref:Uncharacterized protein n=1 Tax=Salix dunnii TaxID=1413687 RepID=A0A835J0J3_9ROSI|nr:hypothetical protein SADUNF_Sadunf19G0010300 [Salix dunnii]
MFTSSRAVIHSKDRSSITKSIIKRESKLETYIIFLKKPEGMMSATREDVDSWYRSFLPTVTTSSSNQQRLVHSYHNVVTGFAAKLTEEEAKAVEMKQNLGFWNHSNYGKGVIIGVLDTGIKASHPSFSDEGMPPPPAKWKGKCEFNATLCNNKLIGARSFYLPGKPPGDNNGHGTHTASTAAGSWVQGASFYGQLNGTAVGIAPSAHLAIYRVCNGFGSCADSDILAGMDTAVEDGVDVLSLSLGGPSIPFYEDSIAIGAFGAIQKGVFVSCAAGNSGPYNRTLSNEAPWILTVGAGIVDRNIRAKVLLGNNASYDGQSFYQPTNFSSTLLPLIYAGANSNDSAFCDPGSLKDVDVRGKVVLCESRGFSGVVDKGQEVKNAGGAAMILMNPESFGNITAAYLHVLPASDVTYADGLNIKAYINSTSSPMATIIFDGTVFGVPYAPQLAYFSSRGPSLASPGILKPDIIGPGVDILAAWPYAVDNNRNTKPATFNMISGTSMATPHLTGIAALLKSSHPDWSPAAIKSAMMTTANLTNLGGTPITDDIFDPVNVFSIGSGHVNPVKADDPGLIYDIQPDDYIPYLCGLGYNDTAIGIIVQRSVTCWNNSSIPEAQLNYPSFSLNLTSSPQTYTRTVTNVGSLNSSYSAEIIAPQGVDVKVTPGLIQFSEGGPKATYSVTFTRTANTNLLFSQGFLNWVSADHVVRSPITVLFA